MSKRKFKDADFVETCDLLWQQFAEDREYIKNQYLELKTMTSGSAERYSVLGEIMAKTSELLLKQTAQILDFVKLIRKDEEEKGNSLSSEEIERISRELKQ